MDRGAWRATVHGVTRVRHDIAAKPPRRSTSCLLPQPLLCWVLVLEGLLRLLWPQLPSDAPSFMATGRPMPVSSPPPLTTPRLLTLLMLVHARSPQPSLVFNTDHPSVKLLHPVSSVPLLHMPLLFPAKILIIQLNRKCTLGILLYVEQKIMRVFFFLWRKEKNVHRISPGARFLTNRNSS